MLLALPARDCSSRLPMDSNHWNRGHEIEWKWKTTRKERIKDLLRTKEDKGISTSVVICIQGADCWGDVQHSWPGRLFTFFTASPLKHLVLMLIGCADLCAGQQLQWTTVFMTRKKRQKSNKSRIVNLDQTSKPILPFNRTFDHRHRKFSAILFAKNIN